MQNINALAPVRRLPAEVLSMVFIVAWQDRNSLRLTHVCRLWRSLLLDTPQFWAIAVAGDEFRLASDDKEPSNADYLATACARSASRALSLRLSSLSSRGHLQLIDLADRITSLQLSAQGGDDLEWLWQTLRAGMPRLEALSICLWNCAKNVTAPHGQSPSKLPRLTRLTLPAILFPFSKSWCLDTIQEIALRSDRMDNYGRRSSRVSLSLVLERLVYYPNLRTLEIDDKAVVEDGDPEDGDTSVFEFTTLERLRIKAHPGTVAAILSCMNFPPSAYIDLEIISDPPQWDNDRSRDWIVASKPRPQPDPFNTDNATLDAIVAQIDQVTIENSPSPTLQGYTDGAERLRVRYIGGKYDRARESERSLTGLFTRANAPVSHLLLTTPPRAGQHPFPFACPFRTGVLVAFPHLTHLSVRSLRATFFLLSLGSDMYYYLRYGPPCPTMPSFASLEDVTLGHEIPLGDVRVAPLRRLNAVTDGRVAAGDFCERCTTLADGLEHRVRQGHRLSRLEFFVYEEGCMADADASLVSHIDLAARHPDLVEDGLKTLQAFVDGPVVFSGYRFFTHTPEVPCSQELRRW